MSRRAERRRIGPRTRSARPVRAFAAALLMAATVVTAGAARGAGEPIVATDLLQVRSVASIDVARDGSRAVLVVRSIGGAGDEDGGGWTNRSHLMLIDLQDAGAEPRQLTFGDREDRSPVLSPDGRQIAFVRGAERAAQLWVLPVDGGEARQLTSLPRGVERPRWAPHGRWILVSAPVPGAELDGTPPWTSERPGREHGDVGADAAADPAGSREQIRAWLAANAAKSDPNVIARLDFQDELTLRGPESYEHLLLVDPTGVAAPRRLTSAFADHGRAEFTADGDRILYVTKNRDGRHPDRTTAWHVRTVNVDGSGDEPLIVLEGWSIRRILPGHDGSVLAFTAQRTDEPAHRPRRLGIVSMKAGEASEPVWLTDEQSVRDVAWMPARQALVFSTARAGGFPLMTMSLGLLEPAALVDERDELPVGVHAFGVGGGAIVYSETSIANPCTVRVRDARGDRLVVDLNAWVRDKTLARVTGDSVTRPDGTRVQLFVMEPTHREAGKTYPLAIGVHGGPSWMWGPGEQTMWLEFQLLCSWGYGVVYANPRGSAGYGYEFQRANWQNWGDGPGGDVLAAVDKASLLAWVDAERLVITGGSYGGYLTAWIIAHDNRFDAAVAQRGVYDLTTFFGEGNAWRLVEWAMGGWPWEARVRPVFQRESPFTFVQRIRTPLLIMHASNDLRTGVSQSEMLYRALKQIDRPVEYVRYPNAGHDLSRSGDPRQRMDRLNRIIEFFDRAIDNPRPAPRLSPAPPPAPPAPPSPAPPTTAPATPVDESADTAEP